MRVELWGEERREEFSTGTSRRADALWRCSANAGQRWGSREPRGHGITMTSSGMAVCASLQVHRVKGGGELSSTGLGCAKWGWLSERGVQELLSR